MQQRDVEPIAPGELRHVLVNFGNGHLGRDHDQIRLENSPRRTPGNSRQQHVAIGDDAS